MNIRREHIYYACYMAACFLLGGLIAGLPNPWSLIALGVFCLTSLGFSYYCLYKANKK